MPDPLTLGILAGTSLFGSLFGSSQEKRAAKQQQRGQEAAIATQERFLSPFAEAGQQGINALQNFVSQGADFSQTQAFKDITNQARAAGQFGSGNRATALTDFFATNFRPQRLNELAFLPSLGAGAAGVAASNIGGLQQNIGTAQARGTVGSANAITSGLNSLSFLGLLNRNNQPSFSNLTGVGG